MKNYTLILTTNKNDNLSYTGGIGIISEVVKLIEDGLCTFPEVDIVNASISGISTDWDACIANVHGWDGVRAFVKTVVKNAVECSRYEYTLTCDGKIHKDNIKYCDLNSELVKCKSTLDMQRVAVLAMSNEDGSGMVLAKGTSAITSFALLVEDLSLDGIENLSVRMCDATFEPNIQVLENAKAALRNQQTVSSSGTLLDDNYLLKYYLERELTDALQALKDGDVYLCKSKIKSLNNAFI